MFKYIEELKLPERQPPKLSPSRYVDLNGSQRAKTKQRVLPIPQSKVKNTLQLLFFNLPKLWHPGPCQRVNKYKRSFFDALLDTI